LRQCKEASKLQYSNIEGFALPPAIHLYFELQNVSTLRVSPTRGGPRGAIDPSKTYESNLIHHNLVQFGKQHSRYTAISSYIILSQQFREVYFISLTVAKLLRDLTTKYY